MKQQEGMLSVEAASREECGTGTWAPQEPL